MPLRHVCSDQAGGSQGGGIVQCHHAAGHDRATGLTRRKEKKQMRRLFFLKVSARAGGGMLIGLNTEPKALGQGRGNPPAPPDPHNYIKITPDGAVTITAKNP